MQISSKNPELDHLLELSHGDNSDRWSNKGFKYKITQVEKIQVQVKHRIWSSADS